MIETLQQRRERRRFERLNERLKNWVCWKAYGTGAGLSGGAIISSIYTGQIADSNGLPPPPPIDSDAREVETAVNNLSREHRDVVEASWLKYLNHQMAARGCLLPLRTFERRLSEAYEALMRALKL